MGHIQLAVPVAHIPGLCAALKRNEPAARHDGSCIKKKIVCSTAVILNVDEATRDQYLANLEAETDLARKAIKIH